MFGVPKCPLIQTQSRCPSASGLLGLVPSSLSSHPPQVSSILNPETTKTKTQKQGKRNYLSPRASWTCFSWTLKKNCLLKQGSEIFLCKRERKWGRAATAYSLGTENELESLGAQTPVPTPMMHPGCTVSMIPHMTHSGHTTPNTHTLCSQVAGAVAMCTHMGPFSLLTYWERGTFHAHDTRV